jgi:hypothetical protein
LKYSKSTAKQSRLVDYGRTQVGGKTIRTDAADPFEISGCIGRGRNGSSAGPDVATRNHPPVPRC